MKSGIILSLILMGSVASATDWPTLIKLSPTLKKESMPLDSQGAVNADVIKLPSGALRFVGFNSTFNPRKTLIIEGKIKDLGLLCQQSVFYEKPFNAELVVEGDPLANPQVLSRLSKFENPVTLTEAKIEFYKQRPVWTVYDQKAMDATKGRPITDYYAELLNAKMAKSNNRGFRLDLSKMNAFACDLAQGILEFGITRTAAFETALPDTSYWIEKDQFASIYKEFWRVQPNITHAAFSEKQNALAEAMAMGAIAKGTQRSDAILKSPVRIQKFFDSIKSDSLGLNPSQKAAVQTSDVASLWKMNDEYSVPQSLKSTSTLHFSDRLDVTFED